jgi:hypothetical protein
MIRRSGSLRAPGIGFPMEIGADIGTFPSASLAGEARLDIGQPDFIRPVVPADGRPVATPIIGTIDQETANAGGSHLCEGDLVLAGGRGHGSVHHGGKRLAGTVPVSYQKRVETPCTECEQMNGDALKMQRNWLAGLTSG